MSEPIEPTTPEEPAGETIDPTQPGPEYRGPYDGAANGYDANGDPLNAYGRTEKMNATAQPLGG